MSEDAQTVAQSPISVRIVVNISGIDAMVSSAAPTTAIIATPVRPAIETVIVLPDDSTLDAEVGDVSIEMGLGDMSEVRALVARVGPVHWLPSQNRSLFEESGGNGCHPGGGSSVIRNIYQRYPTLPQ